MAPTDPPETDIGSVKSRGKDAKPKSQKYASEQSVQTTLSWKDVNVYADKTVCGCITTEEPARDHIIKNVSGEVRSGTILAIMGSSGAGKTTLLNVLSGREMQGLRFEGTLGINGKITDQYSIKNSSAYVQQEDLFLGSLTVREHLYFQSLLRISGDYSNKDRLKRIQELMRDLDLTTCADNFVGDIRRKGISGGERKRVSIASEVLGNLPLLFVDEPTSGLDSHIAEKIVALLKKLSATGKTVICTIHQPSTHIFNQFDELLLLCAGRIAYMGPVIESQKFFSTFGFNVPSNYNPSDFYIQTLSIGANHEERIKRNNAICDGYESSAYFKKVKIDTSAPNYVTRQFKASFWTQFWVILSRTSKNNFRDKLFLYIYIEEFIGAVIFGLLFWRPRLDQTGVKNMNFALFYHVITLMYQCWDVEVALFFERIAVFYRELESNLYSVTAYFWAHSFSSVPYQTIAAAEFSIVFYFLVGLGGGVNNFINYMITSIVLSYTVISFAYLICAICLNEILTTKITNSLLTVLLIMSGTLLDAATIPTILQWTKYVSFAYLGNEAVVVNQWHNVDNISCEVQTLRPKSFNISLSKNITCLDTGAKVVDSLNYNHSNFEVNNVLLVAYLILYRLLANIALCIRLKRF